MAFDVIVPRGRGLSVVLAPAIPVAFHDKNMFSLAKRFKCEILHEMSLVNEGFFWVN